MIASETKTDASLSAVVFGGVIALVALGLMTAYDVGSSARAKSTEIARTQVSADHAAVCDKFGLARTTSERAACIGELGALKERNEARFGAQNDGLL